MYGGKPVIGIVGGIGSGKSFVVRLLGEEGCLVINSDEQVRQVYRDPKVQQTLTEWWGPQTVASDGQINRGFIGQKVFADPAERRRLEGLLHPMVHAAREKAMREVAGDASIKAFIWDTPLLLETGLNEQCDAVVFVDAPLSQRIERVSTHRRWDEAELARRENSQWGLDRKREISDYVISNTADAGFARDQVRDVLSRILAKSKLRG